jgi:hypothetical protein
VRVNAEEIDAFCELLELAISGAVHRAAPFDVRRLADLRHECRALRSGRVRYLEFSFGLQSKSQSGSHVESS